MDEEQAAWLAGLIQEITAHAEHSPGLTIEVEGNASQWIQVLAEADEAGLSSFVLNFPYRGRKGDPLEALADAGLKLPPGTEALIWEDDGYATIGIRPDVPLKALALLIGDVLEQFVGAAAGYDVSVEIKYGF